MTQRNIRIDRRRDSPRDSQRDSVRAIDSGTHSRATDRAAHPERQTGKQSDRNLRLHVVSHMRRSECVLDGAHGTAKSKPAGIKLGMLTSYGRTCEKQEFSSLSCKVGLQEKMIHCVILARDTHQPVHG